MPFTYRAYGLSIQSDIALRGPLARRCATPDVVMAAGAVPTELNGIETQMRHWSANGRELLLRVPEVGCFHVTHGREVTYQRAPGAADDAIGGFLLGSCIGAVLHQRGLPVLHSACIAAGGKAFAICGKSGRGKSTTAAWLVEHGAGMLSDDLAVFGSVEPPTVLPGYPQSKLTGAALDRLGIDRSGLRTLDEEGNKFAVPRDLPFVDQPTPLGGAFVLESGSRPDLLIQKLGGREALRALVKHTYRRKYVVDTLAERHFAALGTIASQVPVWLIVRPKATDSTAALISAISREIDALAPGALEKVD